MPNRDLFNPSYAFESNQAPPREPLSYGTRRPQYSANPDVDSYQMDDMDQIKRDSARGVRKERSASRSSSPQKSAMSNVRRPSTSHTRPSAPISIPRSDLEATDAERSAWIHRDKLARIESQEMAAAGYGLSRSTQRRQSRSEGRSVSRSASRNAGSRAHSTDRHANQIAHADEATTPKMPAFEEYASEGASQGQDSDDYEERLREEPRMDRMYSRSLPRSAVSRIPVARASPAPLSQNVVERDSPLPRSTQGNSSMSSRMDSSASSRTRSRSLGNPAMMVDPAGSTRSAIPTRPRPRSSHLQESPNVTSSPSLSNKAQSLNSNNRAKAMNKAATNSVGRKTVPRTTSKTRNPTNSNSSPVRRPTSGSTRSRPTSLHNRPEGEAPWIAHMYKPDPRLPPDQQMLPTHAKRTMQGQPDSQEETDKSFPKDFDLLSDEELAKMGAFPSPESIRRAEAEAHKQQGANTLQSPWPLTSRTSDARSQAESSQGRSPSYKITPTIAPPIAPPKLPATKSETPRQTNPAVQRMPAPDEKEDGKKKKKLACCVVM